MLFLFSALHHKRETSTSYFVDLLVCVWGKLKFFVCFLGANITPENSTNLIFRFGIIFCQKYIFSFSMVQEKIIYLSKN